MSDIEDFLAVVSGRFLAETSPVMNICVRMTVKGHEEIEWIFSNSGSKKAEASIGLSETDIRQIMSGRSTLQELFLKKSITVSGNIEQVQYLSTWF